MKIRSLLLLISALLCLFIPQTYAAIYMGTDAIMPSATAETGNPLAYPTGLLTQNPNLQQVNCQGPTMMSNNGTNPCAGLGSTGLGPNTVPLYNYPVKTGSLKANVAGIIKQSHWGKLVWTLPFDYRWIGDITLRAATPQQALSQLLKPYPVQAVFHNQNHVVAIVPRRTK